MPTTTQDILSGLAEILHEVAGVRPADVSPDKTFEHDLDLDSLTMVEVVSAAEDRFGVRIPDDVTTEFTTVGDAVAYIETARATV